MECPLPIGVNHRDLTVGGDPLPGLEEGNSEPATIAGVGFMTLDADFRIGYFHSHGDGSQGMTSADVAGMSLWEAYPMTAGSLVEENLRAVMKERVARRFENYHEPWRSWLRIHALPAKDGGLAIYFEDITEEREAAWRKDRFLTTLAHELRNPLAPILTGLEVIRASASDPATIQRVAAMMKRATGQIVHLIDDLLDVTRINTGKFTLKKSRVSLGEILGNAVETARADLQQHAQRFEFTPGRDRIELDGDPVRLEQVVSNLLSNAVKYTPRGGLIRLACGIDERSRPWISVSDSGPGIEPSRHEEIFKPFEQSDCSSGGGLGIGLALVKAIVELHDGSIVVNSDGRGTGSEFIIRLPATDAVADPKEIVMPEMPMPAPSVFPRVLVVEDGKTTADILAMFFEVEGLEVSVAYDGVEALEKVAGSMPDLILMDLGMPRMDGFEAARRIRSLPGGGEVTMVALSGWGRELDKQRSGAAGFDDHLVKPVSPADLRLLLTRFLERSAKADH